MTIGSRLRDLRQGKNYSQEDLGRSLNLSRQVISRWERDLSRPDIDSLNKLSKILGVSTNYILLGEDDRTPVARDSQLGLKVYRGLMGLGLWFLFIGYAFFLPLALRVNRLNGELLYINRRTIGFLGLGPILIFGAYIVGRLKLKKDLGYLEILGLGLGFGQTLYGYLYYRFIFYYFNKDIVASMRSYSNRAYNRLIVSKYISRLDLSHRTLLYGQVMILLIIVGLIGLKIRRDKNE